MHEIVINLHMHTVYSDGTGHHARIAAAAARAGLDAVIITDHNVRVQGMARYFTAYDRRVLVLLGEEIHNRSRIPQKNHLLILGANAELAAHGGNSVALLGAVREAGGLAFIAHPVDPEAPAFREPDISWEDWAVDGITGLELWNGLSELKSRIPTRLHGLFLAFFPALVAVEPAPTAIWRWDELLRHGPCVAIGGSDAHALHMRAGPVRKTVFPYEFHFRAINTHLLLEAPLTGVLGEDSAAIWTALRGGHCFIGYDLPRNTRGFRFEARGTGGHAIMGGSIQLRGGPTLEAAVPDSADLLLFKDGILLQRVLRQRTLTFHVDAPGVYRIEARRRFLGRNRAWIFSNPIYVL